MRVLIATWGYPFAWSPTAYSFKTQDRSVEKKNLKTPLPVLIEALRPDKVLVVGTDTVLYEKNPFREFGEYKTEVEEFIEKLKKSPKGERYRVLKEHARGLIEKFVEREVLTKLDPNFQWNGNLKVVINYNLGWYGKITRDGETVGGFDFRERNPYDYYVGLFYLLYRELKPLLAADNVEIYLDITHGVNYMPNFALRAVEWLTSFMSASKTVKLTVLNTEPMPQPPVKDITLKVFKVFEETYRGGFFFKHLPGDWVEGKPQEVNPDIAKLIGLNKLSAARPDVEPFLVSFIYGIPLGIKEFLPDLEEVEQFITERVEDYEKSVEVSIDENLRKVKVEAKSKLYIPLPKYVLAAILTRIAKPKLENLPSACEEVVKQLINTFYEEPFKAILEKNRDSWLRCLQSPDDRACGSGGCLSNQDKQANLRNLVGHSGLLYQCIDENNCTYGVNRKRIKELLYQLLGKAV